MSARASLAAAERAGMGGSPACLCEIPSHFISRRKASPGELGWALFLGPAHAG